MKDLYVRQNSRHNWSGQLRSLQRARRRRTVLLVFLLMLLVLVVTLIVVNTLLPDFFLELFADVWRIW